MREKWIDCFKGFLIITVVLGHVLPGPYNTLDMPASYIFLFHMPAFFIISGILVKTEGRSFGKCVANRSKRIILPYIIYLCLVAGIPILVSYIKNPNFYFLKKKLIPFLRGGQDLNQFYCGALWFLSCSFFIFLFYFIIEKFLPKKWMRITAYVVLWGVAHYQSLTIDRTAQAAPLLWDVAIIGVVYLAIGHYLKEYIFKKPVFIASLILVPLILIVQKLHVIPYFNNFAIELWSHTYSYPVLDFIIPCGFFVIFANLIKLIPDGKFTAFISDIGKYTLPIMCTHQILQYLFINKLQITNWFIITVVGVFVPYLVGKFVIAKIPGLKKAML